MREKGLYPIVPALKNELCGVRGVEFGGECVGRGVSWGKIVCIGVRDFCRRSVAMDEDDGDLG
jgi:hypothetical protein